MVLLHKILRNPRDTIQTAHPSIFLVLVHRRLEHPRADAARGLARLELSLALLTEGLLLGGSLDSPELALFFLTARTLCFLARPSLVVFNRESSFFLLSEL